MGKIVLLKGFIGRGINGVTELRIRTDDDINLSDKIVKFKGEILISDDYFSKHPLYGVREFTVNTDNILAIVE